MIAVIQRTYSEAKVIVDNSITGKISKGLVILLGVNKGDNENDADTLAEKIVNLRIFNDEKGKMNLSLLDIAGETLVISQFTLSGNCKKGRRPGFDQAEKPQRARELYLYFHEKIKKLGVPSETGIFGADMKVDFVNDGPVTFVLDTDKL
ncbi:MAG: D-aminoacyl-tRNA deacylase [Fidelibacterota bacterium]